jgi:hypothetical protein
VSHLVAGCCAGWQARRKPKVPKGARDFLPEQMAIREVSEAVEPNMQMQVGLSQDLQRWSM